jgi:hypothetical protein
MAELSTGARVDAPSFSIPVEVFESAGIGRDGELVRISVPFPIAQLVEASRIEILSDARVPQPRQLRILDRWPDGSVRWLAIDFPVQITANGRSRYYIELATAASAADQADIASVLKDGSIALDNGVYTAAIRARGSSLTSDISIADGRAISSDGIRLQLRDAVGNEYSAAVENTVIAENGPLKALVECTGAFTPQSQANPLRFTARMTVRAGRAEIDLDLEIWNPRPARHAGNCWDLGDPGSCLFESLTVELQPLASPVRIRWFASIEDSEHETESVRWQLYQDSSGGEYWDSTNHVSADGNLTVSFRGYRANAAESTAALADGLRASPGVVLDSDTVWAGAALEDFWQNFPSALCCEAGRLQVGLFPKNSRGHHELQGGERKRHTVRFAFGTCADAHFLREFHCPLQLTIDPSWIVDCKVVPYVAEIGGSDFEKCELYVTSIIDGPDSFFEKRELIDEYGWRNFGELYADHEAVGFDAGRPLISHYNNQYDFLYAACVHFLRSGDARWSELAKDAARHIVDIDIYHTGSDRAAYNGGLFWHTDHYKDAATATHRTYSRSNAGNEEYGGGPSNEHNYTSGLMLYHFLSGDPAARAAVLELANWVVAMDDPASTIFAFLSGQATGKASSTVSPDFQKAGRGAGNSINALLDAYTLSGDRGYMRKAEEILCRCIHPADDIDALNLDEPEYRWSYLVFLQVLGKFLDVKNALRETDYYFFYARDSLVSYARWMLVNEKPYKDVLDKVDLPTETWPAQDIRKCHILHLAANCSVGESRVAFSERAGYFYTRCITDLLTFSTAYLTRPRVILAVYGHVHRYYCQFGYADEASSYVAAHGYRFGEPQVFMPQHIAARSELRQRIGILRSEVWRIVSDKLRRLFKRGRSA